jgi:hypothetical protein
MALLRQVKKASQGSNKIPTPVWIFPETKQFSAYLDTSRELTNGLNLEFTGAFDVGELY